VTARRAAILLTILGFCLSGQSAHAGETPWAFFKSLMDQRDGRLARPPARRPPAETPSATDAVDAADIPLPRPRPSRPGDRPGPAAVADASPPLIATNPPNRAAAAPPFPFPKPKPDEAEVAPLAMLPVEPEPAPAAPMTPLAPSGGDDSCKALAALGVEAEPLAPISEQDGHCGIGAPAAVAALDDGAVALPVKAIVNCDVAGTLARWLDDTVQPAAKAAYGSRITGLRVAASYECRGRNRVPGAKLSEHAFGNAIDLGAFQIGGGRWLEVGGEHNATDTAFLKTIRGAACGPFKTVLGPGSDPYHAEHFHLDLAVRRTAGPSHGLFCQ
jgi:hypothetical protein